MTPQSIARTELITPEAADALAGLLDLDPSSVAGELPPLWHWIYLLERRAQRDLGPDGHPTSGIPAPPEPGRARMFAGGRVTTHGQLRYGEPATRTTRLVRTVDKEGRSGPMTFSTVRSEIEQGGRTVIADEQDIVYRAAGSRLPSRTAPVECEAEQPPPIEELGLDVDAVVLFRFSALTYNAHRIHYDVPYVTAEGYPDLVVHGPLQALLMGECLRRSGVPMVGAEFAYRLVAPTHGAQRLRATARPGGGGTVTEVRDGAGRLTGTATLRPLPGEPSRTVA
jgi:3-methylfumaryl-CoA hydratase